MLEVHEEEEGSEEFAPDEEMAPTRDTLVREHEGQVMRKRRRPRYYDRKQQLELVLAAQELSEFGDPELSPTELDEEEGRDEKHNCADIWQDVDCLRLIREGVLSDAIDLDECRRIRKRASNYCWKEQKLFFKTFLVPKPEERLPLVKQMHKDLGHFGEQRTLTEIRRRYFWHSRTMDVKVMVKGCQQCQLVRSSGSIRSGDEQLKSIPVCDLFHRVALDTARSLLETRSGNKYILVAIDHYSKWCEAKAVADHGAKTAAKFLEDDIIYRFGVPKFILTDNGGEWAAEFEVMCKDYAIQHQRTAPQWPQCNGMAEGMIKTIKQGITILATTPGNTDCWDEQLAKVLFGYRCGIQVSTRFFSFMILTGRTPRLRADNCLQGLTAETDEGGNKEDATAQFLQKVELIGSIHEQVLRNVEQAQKQQKKVYAARRGKHLCHNPNLAKCGGEAQHLEKLGIWCRNLSIWLATKARRLRGCAPRSRPESHITCSRECKECKECEGVNPHCRNPNLAKCGGEAQHLEKLGIWGPPGLPNVQSSTAETKTPRIGVFLVSLERS